MSWKVHVFGVRHLSPMGAWQLRALLDRVQPELVLVEGPDDATPLLADVVRKETRPPIAILAYTDTLPVRTIVYPLAEYSPEYQAIQWAHARGAAVEFFDLPSDVFLGLSDRMGSPEPTGASEPTGAPEPTSAPEPRPSIYDRIATLAGEPDYDTYWERFFEHNQSPHSYQRAAFELGRTLRDLEDDAPRWRAENLVREAYMRRRIEAAIAAGRDPERIVAVVGAFHAPVLNGTQPALTDNELKRLPRRASCRTLMPYSYFRLSSQSGYGAGNLAPAYFQLLWEALNDRGITDLSRRYLSLVARHLREAGTHRSTAEVIDGVRLAETLSAFADGSAPTLRDLRDAAVTLLGQGERLGVSEALARVDVGTAIGALPEGVSQTSIQADFEREIRRLKLEKYKTTVEQTLELDLRENRRASSEASAFLDLNRSSFLHRLRVLCVSFARPTERRQDASTWAERWVIRWTPESEIALVEAVLLGETVELATAYRFNSLLEACGSIATAAQLVRDAFECGLMGAMDRARQRLQALAAECRDFPALSSACYQLTQVVRFGDVRRFDASPLLPLIEALFVQATLLLLDAGNCDNDAVKNMMHAIDEVNRVALELHGRVEEALWVEHLKRLSDADDRNATLSGFACAILLERGLIENEVLSREVSRRLSPGVPADLGAGWFEGLAGRNRYALLARQALWAQLAAYIESLDEAEFRRAVVFLRRSFGAFSAREKRTIAENLGHYWGVDEDAASELLEAPLTEEEEAKLKDLNAFDFSDL